MTGTRGYSLTYRIEAQDPPITLAELKANADPNLGACDAAVLIPILYPEGGGMSVAPLSFDGRTGQTLDKGEEWKAWALMAFGLMNDPALDDELREIAGTVHAAVKERALRWRRGWR